jgi:DNA-3-methyladenine glycosylase
MRARRLTRAWYARGALAVAPDLLNKLMVTADGRAGRIVEVEAYCGEHDPASHAYRGRTARNVTMFGPPGHLYVYFSYGVHWCSNVVCAPEGVAEAVLLRALEPVRGVNLIRAARRESNPRVRDAELCRGPGRLSQALGLSREHDGADLVAPGGVVWVADDGMAPPERVLVTPRVGISAASDKLWRFAVNGHPGISGPRRQPDGSL